MNLHIGVASASGLIHSASVTAANVHDRHEVPNLLHGNETRIYGDSAYRGKEQRERLREIAPKAKDFLNPTAGSAEPFLDTNRRAYRNEMRRWRRLAGKRVGASRTCVPRSSISSSR